MNISTTLPLIRMALYQRPYTETGDKVKDGFGRLSEFGIRSAFNDLVYGSGIQFPNHFEKGCELEHGLECFPGKVIGRSTGTVVYLGRQMGHPKFGSQFIAIKEINDKQRVLDEQTLLTISKGNNVPQCFGGSDEDLYLELIEGVSLLDLCERFKDIDMDPNNMLRSGFSKKHRDFFEVYLKLSNEERAALKKLVVKEILYGVVDLISTLEDLYGKNVIHNDCKIKNIMVTCDPNGKLKLRLVDFGSASVNHVRPHTQHEISSIEHIISDIGRAFKLETAKIKSVIERNNPKNDSPPDFLRLKEDYKKALDEFFAAA